MWLSLAVLEAERVMDMTDEEVVKKVKELLMTDADFDFFAQAKKERSGEAGGLFRRKGRSGGQTKKRHQRLGRMLIDKRYLKLCCFFLRHRNK
jgi:hypothetical protein